MLFATSKASGAKANQPRNARKKEMVEAQKARMCGLDWTEPPILHSGSSVALLFALHANLYSGIAAMLNEQGLSTWERSFGNLQKA
mmetsp:Transcript_111144/g.208325  ORF Transcript_111144/g.208325 Transcript_111144/m.208325 type:complete len:86 (-) Transcript_111144:22-279(-)